jgi:hypothetical protein
MLCDAEVYACPPRAAIERVASRTRHVIAPSPAARIAAMCALHAGGSPSCGP